MNAIRNVVTAHDEAIMIQYGSDRSAACWHIGDLTLQWIDRLDGIKKRVIGGDSIDHRSYLRESPRMSIEAIDEIMSMGKNTMYKHAAKLNGLSSTRIDPYCQVCRRFGDTLRDQYEPLLFGHFEFAMKYPENTEEILHFAHLMIELHGGSIPSIAYLQVQFFRILRPGMSPDIVMTQVVEGDEIYNQPITGSKRSLGDDLMGRRVLSPFEFNLINRADRFCEMVLRGIKDIQISEERQARIERILEQLQDEIRAVGADLKVVCKN